MNFLQVITEYVEQSASQEDMQGGSYAEKTINSLSNFELIELISAAVEDAEQRGL